MGTKLTDMPHSDLLEPEYRIESFIHSFLRLHNPENAQAMSAYMKGHFPFVGVKSPERRAFQKGYFPHWKRVFSRDPFPVARQLWECREREFQYIALDWLRTCSVWKIPGSIAIFEKLILDRSWWDTVDILAANLVGPYLKTYPAELSKWIDRWDRSDNFWLNRSALIFQLRYKEETDADLLFYLIENHSRNKEFFIRKAIGWSLRELSKYKPERVREFLGTHELSGLSRKEATRYL